MFRPRIATRRTRNRREPCASVIVLAELLRTARIACRMCKLHTKTKSRGKGRPPRLAQVHRTIPSGCQSLALPQQSPLLDASSHWLHAMSHQLPMLCSLPQVRLCPVYSCSIMYARCQRSAPLDVASPTCTQIIEIVPAWGVFSCFHQTVHHVHSHEDVSQLGCYFLSWLRQLSSFSSCSVEFCATTFRNMRTTRSRSDGSA